MEIRLKLTGTDIVGNGDWIDRKGTDDFGLNQDDIGSCGASNSSFHREIHQIFVWLPRLIMLDLGCACRGMILRNL